MIPFVLLIWGFVVLQGETALEKGMERINMSMNIPENAYRDKSRYRAVTIGKDRLEFRIRFMMTDESMKNFHKYLKDLKQGFLV